MSQDANDGPEQDPADLFRKLFGFNFQMPGSDDELAKMLQMLQQQFEEFARVSQAPVGESGINWSLTKTTAKQMTAALGADPSISSVEQRDIADASRLADSWLDAVTEFPALGQPAVGVSRAEWVEATMHAWQQIVEPIVASLANELGNLMPGGDVNDQLLTMLQPMLRSAAGSMYSAQLAQTIAKLASEVLTGSEIGVQLLAQPKVTVLPTNIAAATAGLGLNADDILLFLVVRETARQRLFASVGWLAPQILTLIEHYAREIEIDSSALTEAVQPQDLEAMDLDRIIEMGNELQGKLFSPTQTTTQLGILERLEVLLALVEGWVDVVATAAVEPWLTASSAKLNEFVRRRRVADNPANQALETLVGMSISPRRIRDAQNLWAAVTDARGPAGREEVWQHPDLMPTAADLDDVMGFAAGDEPIAHEDEMDIELRRLLEDSGE